MKIKENIQIDNIDRQNASQLSGLATLYADVFAGPPWNEVTKCASTGDFYGQDTSAGGPCPDCQTPLLEAYPKDETIKYILGELGKSNPIGLLATINTELAGFSWGYQTQVKDLAKSKWKTSQMQDAVQALLSSYGVDDSVFYGSETGVDPQFQGKGLGKQLVSERLKQVKDSDVKFMLVRTNFNSPMYGICQRLEEFGQILGPKAKKGLFSREYRPSYRYVNGLDSENSDRVLFLYDKGKFQQRKEAMDRAIFMGFRGY